MPSQPDAPYVVRFGIFAVDIPAGELRKQDRKIKLQGQPFQLLALLLSRPGEIVSREELKRALWSADTFVEFDQGLNTAIKKIRLALGDSADSPRFVETIPRKGYRFIGPVDRMQDANPVLATGAGRGRRASWAVIVPVLAIFTGAAGWWLHVNRSTEKVYVPGPLTSYPGWERSPSFSRDGNQVAFSWSNPKHPGSHIYTKLIGADEPIQLTRDEGEDFSPAWSPDGRFIAFLRSLAGDRSGVYLVPSPGGPARKVAEVWAPHEFEPPYLAWHPAGNWLVVVDKEAQGQPSTLFLLSTETGEKRRLTLPPPGMLDFGPAVSPDGSAVVFSRNAQDLFLLELTEDPRPKGQPKQITFVNQYTASPAWTPDGKAIVFCSGSPHSPTLFRISLGTGRQAGKPERLPFAGDGARQPAISRQGQLGYVKFTIDANIWRLQVNGALPPALPPVRLIASTRLDHTPQYSPDGARIAFASNRSGSHEIWVSSSDGSGTMRLTSFGGSTYTAEPRWSPDGRRIFFQSSPGGQPPFQAFVIGSDGGKPERVPASPTAWSHDGKWMYFDSVRDGRGEVMKMPARGGQAIQITRHGGSYAQESPDGGSLYYLKDSKETTSLWKVPAEGGDETQVLESVCCLNFAVAKQGIYFIPAPSEAHSRVDFLAFGTGNVTTLAKLSAESAYGLSVSPDGRWLLYSQHEPIGMDLMLVEGFR